jgi:hypothetical protein
LTQVSDIYLYLVLYRRVAVATIPPNPKNQESDTMLDVEDFIDIEGRTGDPEKIRESQRRRGASVELVDEIIELWKIARRGQPSSD